MALGTSDELKSRAGRDVIDVRVHDPQNLQRAAKALGDEATVDAGGRRVALPASGGVAELTAAIRALEGAGVVLDDIALRRPTLDDVFLSLTGHTTETETPEEVPE